MGDPVAKLMEIVTAIEPLAKSLGWDILLVGEGDRPTGLLLAERAVVMRSVKDKALRFDLMEVFSHRGQA